MHRLTSLYRAPVEPRPGPQALHAGPQGQLRQLPRGYPPGSWVSTCRISRIHTYTDISDLAILLNKDTFEPGAFPSPSPSPPRASTWRRASLVVRGMLRRPSVADSLTTTFRSSPHSQQSCQKNATPQPCCAVSMPTWYDSMLTSPVGTVTCVFSTAGDVFMDAEFSAPGDAHLW